MVSRPRGYPGPGCCQSALPVTLQNRFVGPSCFGFGKPQTGTSAPAKTLIQTRTSKRKTPLLPSSTTSGSMGYSTKTVLPHASRAVVLVVPTEPVEGSVVGTRLVSPSRCRPVASTSWVSITASGSPGSGGVATTCRSGRPTGPWPPSGAGSGSGRIGGTPASRCRRWSPTSTPSFGALLHWLPASHQGHSCDEISPSP